MAIEIKVLISGTGWKKCNEAKRVLDNIKDDYDLNIEEVNITENPEAAAQYGVMVSPTLVINGEVAFSGGVKEKRLRQKLDELPWRRRFASRREP